MPRLQAFFEDYGVRPTYLTSYPVAVSEIGQRVFGPIGRSGRGEIGTHMHVWTTPPIVPLTSQDHVYGSLATEIPYGQLKNKMENATRVVGELTGIQPRSYRAGRWGFDQTGLRVLEELGYIVDTSVTPLMRWDEPAHAGGTRGPNFTSAPFEPYYPSLEDVTRPGNSSVLEVPVSIFLTRPLSREFALWYARLPRNNNFVRLLRWTGLIRHAWLSPGRRVSARELIGVARALIEIEAPVLNVMFHSSEMAPGTSPDTRTQEDVEESYRQLASLFDFLIRGGRAIPTTLSEYVPIYRNSHTAVESLEK
jgi:hypothetical protein